MIDPSRLTKEDLAGLPTEKLAEVVGALERATYAEIAERSRDEFLAFGELMMGRWDGERGYQVARHTEYLARQLEAVERGELTRASLSVPRRHGKLIAHDTDVLTPDGWRKHGDLCVGDWVYGLNGHPALVTWIGPDDWADHEVVFTSGHSVVVHADHEWTIWERSGGGRERTVETRWLAERKLLGGVKAPRCTYQLPKIEGVFGADVDLPIHPWVFGVWLGDGRTKHGDICFPDQDVHLYFEVLRCGECRGWFTTRKDTGVHYGSFHRESDGLSLHNRLKALGVGPGSGDKHIPEPYWRASMAQRLELLAGIVDTDGHVQQSGKQAGTRVRVATTSDRLRDDVWSLARSVGYRPTCWTQEPALSSSGIQRRFPVHYVNFAADERLPTRVPRKRIWRAGRVSRDGIVEIRRVEPRPGRCIEVARADGLYLVGRDLQPTHNSLNATELFPAWYMAKHPGHEVAIASYSGDLAQDFGRKIRNMMKRDAWKMVFPKVGLSADSQAADRFSLTNGSVLYAVGRGGALTGRGAHLMILDDMFSNQTEADSEAIRRQVVSFYESVVRTGVYPGGRILMIGTRWREDDLIGYVLKNHAHEGWREIRMPAVLDDESAAEMGREPGEALWPERYSLAELESLRLSMTPRQWAAMYQQRPSPDGGNILKREAWRRWGEGLPPDHLTAEQKQAYLDGEPPECAYVFQVWDTAFSQRATADRSATIVWGVWLDRLKRRHAIMLGARAGRWSFPELLAQAKETQKVYRPSTVIVEAKASGQSLIQELAMAGIWASRYDPGKGDDKVARAYAAQPALEGGTVWAPDRRWADEVIEEAASFPAGKHDDFVDCVTLGIQRMREVRYLGAASDEDDEDDRSKRRRAGRIY